MTPLINQSRRENSAEHSWHLAMYAQSWEHAAAPIDVVRVVKMLLIHDIVEIDAGDVPFHDPSARAGQAELEQQAAERIFSLLPDSQSAEFRSLWSEFEAAESDDARFAKALDRFQPLLHNAATGGAAGWSVRSLKNRPLHVTGHLSSEVHQHSGMSRPSSSKNISASQRPNEVALSGDALASRFRHLQSNAKGAGQTDVNFMSGTHSSLSTFGQASIPRSPPIFHGLVLVAGAT